MALRETGSIVVNAPRERVFEVLHRRMMGEPDLRESAGRLESRARTFVLRDAPGGTRVVLARREEGPAMAGPREELRAALVGELLALQHDVEAS